MSSALKRAGLAPADIDYINAHGTSTMADTIELGAVERLVGNAASKISMSSTKSAIGHLLGAAGAVEAIFSALAIRDNIAPPTLNLDNPDVVTAIDLVAHTARKREINVEFLRFRGDQRFSRIAPLRRVTGEPGLPDETGGPAHSSSGLFFAVLLGQTAGDVLSD
jgi:3-oxoacyl-[acyl-carrier-protein] synthase II